MTQPPQYGAFNTVKTEYEKDFRMNTRYRVHYLLTHANGDHHKDHYDVSVSTPEAAATATRTMLKSRQPEAKIVIGKIKVLRENDTRDGWFRRKRK